MHTQKNAQPNTVAISSPSDLFQQAFQLHQQAQLEQAEALYEALLKTEPQHSDALHFFGVLKNQQGQPQRAVELITRALDINPDNAAAHSNLGLALHAMKRFADAIASYDRALAIKPNAEAYYNRGNALLAIYRYEATLADYEAALAIKPDYIEALSNRGIVLRNLNRFDEALSNYKVILSIKPDSAEAEHGCGVILQDLKRFDEAIVHYDRALALKPDLAFTLGTRLHLKRNICDWQNFDADLAQLLNSIELGEQAVVPFSVLTMSSSLALQKRAAEIYTTAKHPSAPRLPLPAKHTHQKIKLGYFSSDFRQHPVSYLTAELFERHDRSRFEVIAFSFHATDVKDAMRLRLEAAFDQFHDVSQQSDQQIVDLARQLEIDIAIDLNGCTDGCRTDIFAMRAAPVQVNYLGYLGTMGADYINYLLADSTLIPAEHQAGYSEKIAYLPHSFQVNDSTLAIADRVFTRTELGLPEQGFVFCCFNNQYKITPAVFDSWMRILHQVDGSVLWLLGANNDVEHNLRHAAIAQGIDANRLVLANRAPMPEYLARHRCADLFLDTQPYNAGATASAALWAGLPVLTCLGDTLSGRMGASLLHAIGLPELITRNPEEYEALAIQLAAHPEQLSTLKHKLAANRLTSPLFNTELFTQHIEAAFQAMFDRYQADLAPEHIYVTAQSDSVTPVMHAESLQHAHALHLSALLATHRGDWQQAVELLNQSLAINPDNAVAYLDLDSAFQELLNFNQALASYDHALKLKPDYVEAFYNRGNLFLDYQQFDKAVLSYDSALRLKPNDANALHNRGIALKNLHRYDEAVVSYGQALAINPDTQFLFGDWLYLKMSVCNWDNLDRHLDELEQGIQQGKPLSVPFTVLAFSDSIALQKQVAVSYAAEKYPSAPLLPLPPKHAHKKIKIGYFSADFYHHATAYLMAELFERHDKTRFDIVAFSFSPVNHQDALRLRLEAAFDRFIDVSQQSDEQVVRLARQLEIDIAIDLKGYTEHSRPNIFAMRAAPIQVNYLGYPSTMGADYMDYLLADSVLIPPEYQAYYSEKIAYLPHSYQVNDAKRVIANKTFTRAELGLPAHGIVFCCFNSNYKITPSVFDSWMRILHEVDGSVLWLLEDNASAVNNLRKEASACDIDPKRLCFAKRMTLAEHLARQRIADLFLDTSPCNAHTTASDALWAGLPVLTCIGDTFAGRVAASLLTAIGLPELITDTLEDYEALAIQLATHPKQLAALKQKLADNRLRYPLFDTALFTQHIEAAYQLMFTRYQADLAPEHIYVPAQAVSKQPPPEVNNTKAKQPPEPAKSSGLFAKLLTGITRRKDKAADAQQLDESFTQAEANTFARAQRLHQQGQLAAAEILYEQLLKTQPHHPELLRCLAALKKLHPQPPIPAPAPPQPAQSNAEQLLAHLNQGLEYQDANRLTDALNSYERVLVIDPHHIDALINRGNVLEDLNRLTDALASYDRAIAARPDYARAHSNRGNVLQSLQRFDEALASYDKALAIQPDYAVAFYNRGNTLQACKRPQDAIQSYQYALAIKPDFIQALISLGNALHDDQRFEEALSSYDRALAIQPDHAEALYNRGNVLHDLNRYDDAIDSYNRALAIKPDDAGARWNASFCYLILGDFANGWKNYEARWQTDDFIKAARHFSAPQWSGDEALQGKTILLYGEQGLGDTLHFCRYAKQVAALGGRVILEVPKALLPLLAKLEGVEQLIAQGEPLPSFDFHSPLLSLPLAFNTRLDSIPADTPYLFSNPDKVQHWQAVLGTKNLPRVGVVWSGNAAHKNDHNRSLALSELLPLLTLDCQFISLQKELHDTDTALLTQLPQLQHYGTQLHDFTDTAALIELTDVVISVDTSVAHLAAAMGKPTWILLADNQDWRWLLNRADSPWYPSVRLFRQTQRGDWQDVIKQVQHALSQLPSYPSDDPKATKKTTPPSLDSVDALINQGNDLEDLGRFDDALARYDLALSLNPDYARAHSNRGNVLQLLQRFNDALASYDRALAVRPDYAEAFFNRGNALRALLRFDEALSSYDKALAIKAEFILALIGRGVVLQDLNRFADALACYDRVLVMQPDYAEAHYNRGNVLQELQRFEDALAAYDAALNINPEYVEALGNRGAVLQDLKRFTDALDSYNRALAIQPDHLDILEQRGIVLQLMNRVDDALRNYEHALALNPDREFIFGTWLSLKMKQCDWRDFADNLDTLTEKITTGNKVATPFFVHSMSASTAVQQQAAQLYAQAKHPRALLLPPLVKHAHTKIKIAYFSADFRNHPVAYLIAELLERHDRTSFEVLAFSFNTPVEKSPARLRLEAACDHFIDVSQQSDEQVVQLARHLEIDIAIDLNGFTDGCRTDIFALRAAPIQVVYLGYLGTMGTDYMDYILADSTLIPAEHQAHYNEKITYLPHSFQVNDSKLPIANRTFTRAECGLPAHGFVFCCFNNNYKITPTVFASWMRILQQVDGSVLWLLEDNNAVISNLRHEATVRGVNAERIVFAKRLPMPEYLARHRVADLFLDTQPYNAGATASGALWSGLPVLTCLGSTFAGRMAASLLNAIGLPELITANLADYETLAVQLATHPEQLAAIKQTLADNRLTQPLFDTQLFTHHIESAYQAMFAHYQADLTPEYIYVQAQESIMPANHANQFQHAMRLHKQNQLAAAEALYEDILRTQPQHIDALHFLGVLKNQQGQTQRAVELISQSLALYPDNAAAHCNLALALQSLQRLDDAVACYDTVLALQPNAINALSGRGIVLQMLNRFDEALLDYDRILAIDPHHAEALFGRANVLYKLKRLDAALISYQGSLAINPDSVEALYNQGLLLVELNRIDDAIISYQKALAIKADYAEVHNNLGLLLKKQERHAEAEASYQHAIASKPDYMEAYCNLITLLKDQGRTNDAQATINAALAALPDSLELRFIQLIMSLPMVTHTVTEAALVATHFDTALTDLENWLMQSPNHQHSLATAGLLPLPFLLAYRTGNHVQRLSRYGDIVAVQGNAVAVDKTRTKLKMVVVSHHFHRHSVWDVITRGLLVNIDRSRFELVLYHLGGLEDQETAFAKSLADGWRDTQTVSDVHGWLSVLADDKPDVIFYPEIGMDPMSARLAAHRVAPLQIASWGHPITTGLPAIDLYFSGDLLESADADRHYRERLIRLPSTGCCTTLFNVTPEPLPELAAQLATRQGISFIIPQTVYKFDPADDGLYADIASVVGNCTFILLHGRDNAWAMDQVVARLEQTFIDRGLPPDQHLLIIPWQSVEKFQTLLDLCDMYLDCPSFSGYTTAWQAAHRGIPIVTLEGEFMRQRLAAGLLRKIGITDTIAQSREEYVQLAVKLAEECRNPVLRNARRQRLKTAAPKADNDVSVVRAFEQSVIEALAKRGI
ncbi:MAG: tetratricopeptide repeat protein [Methylococcales bacterium]|nr:tetratricopeptide repeat protein [Methylococcales bacterium]